MQNLGEVLYMMQNQLQSLQHLTESIIDSCSDEQRRVINIKFYSQMATETIGLSNKELASSQAKRIIEILSHKNVMLSLDELEITKTQKDMLLNLVLEGVEKV